MDRETENIARRCTKALFFDSLRALLSSCEDGGLREDTPPNRSVVNQTLSFHAPNSMTAAVVETAKSGVLCA